MSSIRRHPTSFSRPATIAFSLALALLFALSALTTDAFAAKSKLPKITKVEPNREVNVGQTLNLTGTNFIKGKKTLVVIFRRDGSTRRFTARGNATSKTRATIVVPDVTGDIVRAVHTQGGPLDNMFRMRAITKFGAAKTWTSTTISPRMAQSTGAGLPADTGAAGDCDLDAIPNGVDTDDDNDLLADIGELAIGTDPCNPDTDGDIPTDFYEYTVAYDYNGGPVLPYPGARPYPNPLNGDADTDHDGDGLTSLHEFRAWQYTGLMTRFYSDADQDSDGDGKTDDVEDEDRDMLPNLVELEAFKSIRPLNWLKTDTDGDGLCDGLDDQDHDGPPTPLSIADCLTPVPNNGPGGTPPTNAIDSVPGGDPDGARIDGDDNMYSNFYEWYFAGAGEGNPGGAYLPCLPSLYPVSPYCPADWDPLPTAAP